MAKKFDTNPLDPDFPEKVKDLKTQTLQPEPQGRTTGFAEPQGETRSFSDPLDTEEQTRPLYEPPQNGVPPVPPGMPVPMVTPEKTSSKQHKIGSISLPENVLMMLPYIPFVYLGLIAGIIELIFIPKTEPRVRYHAAQGVAAHIGIWLVTMILGMASLGSDLADVASTIFGIVTTIMLLVFAYKAWQGKPIHIETVESLTDWLEEKISPTK